jgi:hypothetical protein
MAEYELECRRCKRVFALLMRVMERAAARFRSPGCGSDDVEPLMQPFPAKIAKKSLRGRGIDA